MDNMFKKLICLFLITAVSFTVKAQQRISGSVRQGEMQDAQFIIPTAPRSRIVVDTLYSNILPESRAYTVLLPRNYDTNLQKKYPIVYLLHGIMDTNEGWYKNGRVKMVMDKLVESGEADEMIIVTPDAGGNIYGFIQSIGP